MIKCASLMLHIDFINVSKTIKLSGCLIKDERTKVMSHTHTHTQSLASPHYLMTLHCGPHEQLTYLYTNACCVASDVSSSTLSLSGEGSGGAGTMGGGNRLFILGGPLYPPDCCCCSIGFGGSFFQGGSGRPGPSGGGSTACFGEGARPNGGLELEEEDKEGGGSFSSAVFLLLSRGGVGTLLLPGLGGRNGLPPSGEVPRLPSMEEGETDLSL